MMLMSIFVIKSQRLRKSCVVDPRRGDEVSGRTGNSAQGCSWRAIPAISESSILFKAAYHAFLRCYILSWQLQTCKQTIWWEWIENPSSIFKDAVDGLFQQSPRAPTFYRDLLCLLTTQYTQWTIANLQTNHLAWMDRGSFKRLQGFSWRAIPAIFASSNLF